jgi:hypothetical protein
MQIRNGEDFGDFGRTPNQSKRDWRSPGPDDKRQKKHSRTGKLQLVGNGPMVRIQTVPEHRQEHDNDKYQNRGE